MARLPLVDVEKVTDPEILGIFAWVTEMEGKVPNHFAVELNFPELMKLTPTLLDWILPLEEGLILAQA